MPFRATHGQRRRLRVDGRRYKSCCGLHGHITCLRQPTREECARGFILDLVNQDFPGSKRHRITGRTYIPRHLQSEIVALDNREEQRIGYAIGDFEAPMWVLFVGAAVGGMFIGWLIRHRPRNRD